MKFIIQALGLTAGGGKDLALNLLSRLANHASHEFVVLVSDLPEYAALGRTNLELIVWPKPRSLLGRHLFLNHTMHNICAQQGGHALLCLGNFAPRKPPCHTVVLLQNAYMVYREPVAEARLTLRERLTVAYGRNAYRRLSPWVRVVAQTEVIRQRLLSRYNLDPRRVSVIPNRCLLPEDSEGNPPPRTPMRPFTFLCLGRYYAHKNLEILPEAVKRLPAYTSRPAQCITTISGDQHPGAGKLLRRMARENLEQVLVNTPPVPSARLEEVYRSADALILPTLLESFTRTYLEAMHFGLPILTSDRDFAHNLCQDAALYFDPLDADSVAKSMARIMEDGELRLRLTSNGKRLLKQSPTWDEIAAQFVAVLERAATGREAESESLAEARGLAG